MFENLSNREKKLLLAIGTLVPIAIVFVGIFQLIGSFEANNQELESLDIQIVDQEELELQGMLAGRRQTYYANASLHPSINIASNDYQNWLKTTMAESGLTWTGVTPGEVSRLRSNNKTIGQSMSFKVPASGTLVQFNDFLSKFYQLDVLHRITAMTLTPQNEPRTKKPVRTGLITAKMTFEVLSLQAGKNRDGFADVRKHLVNSKKNYDEILRRNIFGPANSEPVISASNKTTTTGKPYSFSITAKDANKNDLLKIELLESSIDDAALTQAKETDRRAKFEMPNMPPGKYNFKVKVSDTGFPVKSSTKEFVVTVKEPRKPAPPKVVVKKPEPKPEPEVDYIRLVKVTGITQDRDGKWRAWVSVGPTGERLRLSVGETFEIGEKEYEVVSVEEDEATFSGDDKTFVARPDFLTRGSLVETNL